MLIKEPAFLYENVICQYERAKVVIMSELAIIAALVKSTFLDVSKQASALANGLQNAAPGSDIKASPNKSVQYLLDISAELAKSSEVCGEFLTISSEKPK